MTDEERAEEYMENYKTLDGRSLDWCDIYKAFLDGLKAGRAENEARLEGCHNCQYMADRCDRDEAHCVNGDRYVRLLEKQNNELKTMLEKLLEKLENGN